MSNRLFDLPSDILTEIFVHLNNISDVITLNKKSYNIINADLFWIMKLEKDHPGISKFLSGENPRNVWLKIYKYEKEHIYTRFPHYNGPFRNKIFEKDIVYELNKIDSFAIMKYIVSINPWLIDENYPHESRNSVEHNISNMIYVACSIGSLDMIKWIQTMCPTYDLFGSIYIIIENCTFDILKYIIDNDPHFLDKFKEDDDYDSSEYSTGDNYLIDILNALTEKKINYQY